MILFSHKCGQLGNRLFTFAHLIANAAEHKIKVSNLSFDEYAQYFPATAKDIFCRYPAVPTLIKSDRIRTFFLAVNRATVKVLRKTGILKTRFHNVVTADLPEYQFGENKYFDLNSEALQEIVKQKYFVFLFGRFFRDHLNFEKHQDLVRAFFTPTNDIQMNVNHLITRERNNNDLLIGVHIRLGDYAQFADGKYFFHPPQYRQIMKSLEESLRHKKIKFIICSNEKLKREDFQGLNFALGTGHLVEDLYTLACTDLIMGPPSTFSSWASFYGNKPICQLRDIDRSITELDFVKLPLHFHYNFK